ncbi:GntR family transcriptional regulator [Tepidimonas aquatica]|uniref:Putative D-xylose utilization operon transcriptional repressor n=1 Tax=Tepidimonas aquatica TaxID=247482 RepID=A0A554WSR8_9BURK|nr:GntR family transcriptional regulator [Tepidimonas aquatica]TSE26629.1 putative D-xylose utilization operon transcriptional repressor [Tepidimonas aquatica]
MTAVPLLSRALYEEVADWLRQRIFSRELPPGTWIDEMKIAQELGISRTPLREAIKVLAAEGLVTMKVRRGAYVTEVSQQDLREVYELLALLEADAAEAACWRATDEELAELRRMHEQLEAAADPATGSRERFFELNEAFHLRVLDLGHNRWRKQLVQDLRKVMKLNRHGSLFKQGRVAESLAEHRAILDALCARNPKAAAEAVRRHFANGLQAAV